MMARSAMRKVDIWMICVDARFIDAQHIGTAGGGIGDAGLGRIVHGLIQKAYRLGVPQAAGGPGQQLRLVVATLPQTLFADRNPGHGIELPG